VAAVVDDDLGDKLGASAVNMSRRRPWVGGTEEMGREYNVTWIDQQTAPIVPRTLAAIGTSISKILEIKLGNYMRRGTSTLEDECKMTWGEKVDTFSGCCLFPRSAICGSHVI
jgi:hypothetical protein